MSPSGCAGGAAAFGALPPGQDRVALLTEVTRALSALPHGAAAIVAVSGGPDSAALAWLVAHARSDLDLHAVHVRHRLRNDLADAAAAERLADGLGIAFHVRAVTVQRAGEGVEAAARQARYDALQEAAATAGVSWLLVGHTADDQAETVLLNLVRGAGLAGLAGMRATSPRGSRVLARPLLRLRRADVRAIVDQERLPAVHDPTNLDPDLRRTRVRTRVLPALAELSGGPGDPVGALVRLADLARQDSAALDAFAAQAAGELIHAWGPGRALLLHHLHRLEPALATRVVRQLLGEVDVGAERTSAATVARVLALRPGGAMHITGGTLVTCGGGWVAAVPAPPPVLNGRSVSTPGVTPLPELGLALHAAVPREHADAQASGTPVRPPGARGPSWTAVAASAPLRVRARSPGDRLRLPGGTRKLQDLFVDQGVPRALRDLVPVVVDGSDEPVWVPGVAARAGQSGRLHLWLSRSVPGSIAAGPVR